MKKHKRFLRIITFITAMYSSAFANAQSNLDQTIYCRDCPENIQIHKVSQDKKLDSLQYQLYDKKDQTWKTVLKVSFEYNNKNQVTKETCNYIKGNLGIYRNDGLPGFSQHTYTYDNKGNLTEDLFKFTDEIAQSKSETEDSYIPEDLNLTPERTKVKGEYKDDETGNWYVTPAHQENGGYTVSYIYNKKNRLEEASCQKYEGNTNSKNFSINSFSYLANGKVSNERLSFIDSNQTNWRIYKDITYKYDSKGVKTEELIKRLFDPTREKPYLCIPIQNCFSYNSSGEIIKELHKQLIDTTWEDYEQIIKSYNNKGDSLYILKQVADGGVWYNAVLTKSKIDTKKQIASTTTFQPEFDVWQAVKTENYTYDATGNRLTYQNSPIRDAEFSDSYRCLYFYSSNTNKR